MEDVALSVACLCDDMPNMGKQMRKDCMGAEVLLKASASCCTTVLLLLHLVANIVSRALLQRKHVVRFA